MKQPGTLHVSAIANQQLPFSPARPKSAQAIHQQSESYDQHEQQQQLYAEQNLRQSYQKQILQSQQQLQQIELQIQQQKKILKDLSTVCIACVMWYNGNLEILKHNVTIHWALTLEATINY